MMKYIQLLSFCCLTQFGLSQDNLPHYYQIPDHPENYTAGTVAARIVDGLGFRFYWATDGLRDQDLKFKPNDEARTVEETVQHIYGMSYLLISAIKAEVATSSPKASFEDMRRIALENFRKASDLLKQAGDGDMEDYKIIFKNDSGSTEYPFWNMLNGPIADCLWHTGQIVSLRRSSGNPFNSKVSVLAGRMRE